MDISTTLRDNEKVLWEGKTDEQAAFFQSIIVLIGFIIAIYIIYLTAQFDITCTIQGEDSPVDECLVMVKWILGAVAVFTCGAAIALYYYLTHMNYLVTDQRVLVKNRFRPVSLELGDVKKVSVSRGVFGRVSRTGTIVVDSELGVLRIAHVKDADLAIQILNQHK